MKILYFTATGNCLYVAKRIGGELLSIPKLICDENYVIEDDKVGIIVPTYGFVVPGIVKRYLEKATIKADYIFGIMTYGNVDMSCTKILNKMLGGKLDYSNTILMIDNYLPVFKIENQLAKEDGKKIEAKIDSIIQDIKDEKRELLKKSVFSDIVTDVFAKGTYSKSIGGSLFKRDNGFSITSECTKCGMCLKTCPVGNIALESIPKYNNHCEFCLSCIHMCPVNAIQLKSQKSKARFINQNITKQEIIASNDV